MRFEDQMDEMYRKLAPGEWWDGYVPPGGDEELARRRAGVPFMERVEQVQRAVGVLWLWALAVALMLMVLDLKLEVNGLREELGKPEKYRSRDWSEDF